ncbi:hypothetical protein [Halobellus litoreus]|uniref:Uncharacterized protein n=1 Tax=Halobellus litoreus TaxID=755310 RepID=A0ABD6DWR3_9EURY|nr:hypothetical protein [Halobellus litoreus]
MGRSIEISGKSVVYLFYASSLAIVPLAAYFVVWPLDTRTSVLVAVLLTALVVVAVADLWYWRSGKLREHLNAATKRDLPYDITYDPSADPGQAAKQRWMKSIRRLSDEDDEER